MLFLFVLMLVGRDSSDSVIEVLRGQRVGGAASASASRCCWSAALGRALHGVPSVGLAAAQRRGGNVQGIAQADLHQVRVRVRGHLGAADHGGGRRDGAGRTVERRRGRRSASGPRCRRGSRPATTPVPDARPGRLRHRQLGGHARRCCPTARSPTAAISAILRHADRADRAPQPTRTRTGGTRRTGREPDLLPLLVGAAVHDRRGRRAGPPQRDRAVHVHRADAQRGQPRAGHVRPASTARSTARSWRSSSWSSPRPRSWSASRSSCRSSGRAAPRASTTRTC